jgi:hypothetical protein
METHGYADSAYIVVDVSGRGGGVEAWARAVVSRLEELNQSQRWLGEQAAEEEGRSGPYGQGTIGDWLRTGPPKPSQAFAIERALGVEPGSQTRFLGYLPLEARPALTIDEAVDADGGITEQMKRMLKTMAAQARQR